MIVYDLECTNGHTFEGWFKDINAFEDQKHKRLITCPVCNDTAVVVVPSTFAIKSVVSQAEQPKTSDKAVDQWEPHKVLDFLEKNFENVGTNFSREALKMHYGVSEKRNIRGTSTQTEEETLEKEGIKFIKLPLPRLDS